MKYIFFTNSMGGYSGGPTYVRNKLLYLKEKGWNVSVFDSTGLTNAEIMQEDLKKFEGNRYKELFFNPFWLRKSRRNKIISEIIRKIGNDDNIVIESNGTYTSIWGELISSLIGAKHIVYVISERQTIKDESFFQFYKFKSLRNELFSISEKAYIRLLSRYENVSDASQHYWTASTFVPIENVECEELKNVERADYNIGHFGRLKGYFDEMFKGVSEFANKHIDKSVNFILLGDAIVPNELKKQLPSNVSMYQLNARQPIPMMFFDKTDVVVAVSGCARIAARNGAKVISMDVYNNRPLGVLGYTTTDTNMRSGSNEYSKSLPETLDDVLVNRLYDTAPPMEIKRGSRRFDYQLGCVTSADRQYYDVKKICVRIRNIKDFILRILLFFNQVGFCSFMRYHFAHK